MGIPILKSSSLHLMAIEPIFGYRRNLGLDPDTTIKDPAI